MLGVSFGIAVLVGNTIGSGILRVPGEIAGYLPSTTFFLGVWIAGGIYALLGSNALAEVAALVHESGGYTVFVRRGLGPFLGFVAGWSDWLSSCTSATAAALFIGEAASGLARLPPSSAGAIACAILFALALLQSRGVRTADGTQRLTSALKALALLVFIVICLATTRTGTGSPSSPSLPHGASLFVDAILAIQAVIFAYDGWIGPAYFAGELRDPGRELPRSIFGGVLTVIIIYLLFNLALLRVVPMAQLAHDPLAAGTATAAIFGAGGDSIFRVLVILIVISLVNAVLMTTSRVFYALSRAQNFSLGAHVNRGGTPTIALFVSTFAAAAFLLSGTYNRIIAITAFLFVANYTFTFLSLFALRIREPNTPRPYRAWGHPWTTGLVLLVSLGLLGCALVADTWNSIASLILLLISYPIFRVVNRAAQA